jgi:hypothetical protein
MSKSGKQLIVHALLDIGSGTAKEIAKRTQLKYHSTYKLLQKLCDKHVILKQNDVYTPNPKWVTEKKEFLSKLHKFEEKELEIEQNAYQFTSVFDYMQFIQKVEQAFLERDSAESVYKIVTHAHHFFLDPTYDMDFFTKLKQRNIPINLICYGDSAVDKWTKNNLEKLGANIILGHGMGSMMVFYIYDTVALEVLYSHEFRDALRNTFGKYKSLNEINLVDLHTKLNQLSYRIHVKAITDSAYITDLRSRAERVASTK